MKVLILDTSAFIQGLDPQGAKVFTVPLVEGEVRDEMAKIRLMNAIETGRLVVKEPEESYSDHVNNRTRGMGEAHKLSATDKQILALGFQLQAEGLDPVIVSDDYSVQNMADTMGLKYRGMATQGIKSQLQWGIYCPGCRRRYDEPQLDDVCPICGTELKRKPIKKRGVRRQGGR
ncbi:MAG: hypothetical protein NWE89_05995 [Candidatus Bathyarchaeota archaeon]|nr:hypothetical protein [Candidatus Bathyarchaeota archaeon]